MIPSDRRCGTWQPNVVETILNGRQPAGLRLAHLIMSFPISWQDLNELKSLVEAGLKQRSDFEQANKELKTVNDEIGDWSSKAPHGWGTANVKVNLKEQPHLPTNTFLLTAADALASSKTDISQFVSQSLIQALNLQGKDADIKKTTEQAVLVMGANTALNAAKAAEADLQLLPATATDQARRDKITAFENAKIAANTAFLKACLTPPYPASFGGNVTITGC